MDKMIVLDLDGTLLQDDKTVSKRTTEILLQAKAENNIIVFATARPPRDTYKYLPTILRDNMAICYNGAYIVNGKEILYKKEMNKSDILDIIKKTNELGYNEICLEIRDTLYSNFDTSKFFGKTPTKIVNLEKLEFETACKVIVCSKKAISQKLINDLPKSCRGIITDNGELCQIMHSETSKWKSIKILSEKLGINRRNIVAFGNDYNDIDMIKNAGIGIAMKNAEDSVKKIADFVTDSNMNEGVAKYIKENILRK